MKQMKPSKDNSLFFAMGMVVAMAFLLVAFEWTGGRSAPKNYSSEPRIIEELDINITKRLPEPPKPKIEPPQVIAPDEIVAVDAPVEHREIFSTENTKEAPQITFASPVPRMVEKADESIFDFAEVQPAYIGGSAAMMKFLSENVRYPQVDIEMGTEGRVICTFVVEKDGSITDIQVVRGVSPGLDKEAMRVIAQMPNWKPGFQNGKPVRVKFTLPVFFKITKQ